MNKIIIFSALLLVITSSAALAIEIDLSSSATSSTSSLQVSSLKYEPYPVEPGEIFDLWVKVRNNGNMPTKDATCRLAADNPFSLYQGEMEQHYGILGPGNEAILKYTLKVSNDAADGDNPINIECTDDAISGVWQRAIANITIQSRYPTLNIVKVETEPSAIEPGHKADLILSMENSADSSMKDIDVKLDFSDVPFAPYNSIGEQKLRRLDPADTQELTFNIVALPTAEGGIYKVPISISYTDNLGTAHSINDMISIEINSMPDFYLTVDSSALTSSSRTGDITLKITNKGLTNIKFMNLKILSSKQLKIISADTVYVGSIDSDDSQTADFKITAKSSNLIIPVEMDYRDANNNLYTTQANVTYILPSAAEAGQSGVNWLVILIIIALVVFAFIKRHKILNWIKRR